MERSTGRPALRALERFERLADDLADIGARNLAGAALRSLAGDLRAGL